MDMLNNSNSRRSRRAARLVWRALSTGIVGAGIIAGTQTAAHANAAPQPLGDYTGDHKTDIAVWRPSNGYWYWIDSNSGGGWQQQWGAPDDVPVSADFSYAGVTDGIADRTVWRPSNGYWYWIDSRTGSNAWQFQWGVQGDIPAVGDFDGDGKSDIAVWRHFAHGGYPAGTWSVVKSSNWSSVTTQWGTEGDVPVACDYDGDGKSDYAVFRPSNGNWYVVNSTGGAWYLPWGQQGDVPVPGNYDGDNRCDIAIWHPSTGVWSVVDSSSWTYWTTSWGGAGDVPSQADYDGDGKTDLVVWRPSDGTWYGIRSSNWTTWSTQWGTGGPNNGGIGSDVALPNYPGNKNQIADLVVPQQQSNWCWAATTQMAAAYSFVSISQCQEANVNTGRSDCCTNAASASDTTKCNQGGWWTLTSHGFTETDLWDSAITFTQLQNEMNANCPVPFAWAWTGGGGHAMVAVKTWVTSAGTPWVTINDPWPPNVGARTDMLYTTWVSAPGHSHWRDSYNVIRSP